MQPNLKTLRNFGLLMGFMIIVIFGLVMPLSHGNLFPLWPWILAVVFWLFALLVPGALSGIYQGWMKIGHVLGWINIRLILGTMFFLIVTPTALVLSLWNRDVLTTKPNKRLESYRVKSQVQGRLEEPF